MAGNENESKWDANLPIFDPWAMKIKNTNESLIPIWVKKISDIRNANRFDNIHELPEQQNHGEEKDGK
ncbi:MAG: hypothetical protein WCL07_03825 [bacterium]